MTRLSSGLVLGVVLALATPARSLTPPPPCDGAIESGMTVANMWWLGDQEGSGYTVESYYDARSAGREAGRLVPSVPALMGFVGTRVVECSSGQFLMIPEEGPQFAAVALSATEFLRDTLRSGRSPAFSSVRQAAEALYGPVTVLRETDETCGCSVAFPDRRPAGMTPYSERPDLG